MAYNAKKARRAILQANLADLTHTLEGATEDTSLLTDQGVPLLQLAIIMFLASKAVSRNNALNIIVWLVEHNQRFDSHNNSKIPRMAESPAACLHAALASGTVERRHHAQLLWYLYGHKVATPTIPSAGAGSAAKIHQKAIEDVDNLKIAIATASLPPAPADTPLTLHDRLTALMKAVDILVSWNADQHPCILTPVLVHASKLCATILSHHEVTIHSFPELQDWANYLYDANITGDITAKTAEQQVIRLSLDTLLASGSTAVAPVPASSLLQLSTVHLPTALPHRDDTPSSAHTPKAIKAS